MCREKTTKLEFLEKKFRKYLLFIIFTTAFFPFWMNAIEHIEQNRMLIPNDVEYKVHLPKNSQINFNLNDNKYIAKCHKELCKPELDQQFFIGNSVEYLAITTKSQGIIRGVIVRGTFKKKSDNLVYKIELTKREVESAINKYRREIWLSYLLFFLSFIFGPIAFIGYIYIWFRIKFN